jgi:ABC-type transporter Mla subunit MlaD
MMMAASGALIAGGVLLLTGQRRAGLVTAASGTALALLDQQDALRHWWSSLPGYMERVQALIGRVQSTVDDLAEKREQITQAMATGPKEV